MVDLVRYRVNYRSPENDDPGLISLDCHDFMQDIFPDKAAERNILSCHVKCPSKGCEWTGETRYVEVMDT